MMEENNNKVLAESNSFFSNDPWKKSKNGIGYWCWDNELIDEDIKSALKDKPNGYKVVIGDWKYTLRINENGTKAIFKANSEHKNRTIPTFKEIHGTNRKGKTLSSSTKDSIMDRLWISRS